MSGDSSQETRRLSADALKAVYLIIVGLALVQALSLVLEQEAGQGSTVPRLLLVAFLATFIRFVHGASLHLELDLAPRTRFGPLINFIGFLFQGMGLFLMALSVADPFRYAGWFLVMLAIDLAWLVVMRRLQGRATSVSQQWMRSDVLLIVLLGLCPYAVRAEFADSSSEAMAIVVTAISLAAAVWDYRENAAFYFGPGSGKAPRRVVIESPFKGDEKRNKAYLRSAMKDCLMRNEAPFASHGLYTQEGVLDDQNEIEREKGIRAGFAWHETAEAVVVYEDLGVSPGMSRGIESAESLGIPVERRRLAGWESVGAEAAG